MNKPKPAITINVDLKNPGHFFACCGLLELAERLWHQSSDSSKPALGWFSGSQFFIATEGGLDKLVMALTNEVFIQVDPNDKTASPIQIGGVFQQIQLDWWSDPRSGGKDLKVWAGTMESFRIARAMQNAMRGVRFTEAGILDVGTIAYDPMDPETKVEPYYFDARRGPNAHSRDVGFSPNALQLTTTAFPAVELLCLIGLQRCLPSKGKKARTFEYFTWDTPIPTSLLQSMISGKIPAYRSQGYVFENWYRTGQKKHKSFRSATPMI